MDERITVTVGDENLARVDEVAAACRAAGMTVDEVLGNVGIITGSVPAACRTAVEEVPGVNAVEGEQQFQLPPPDAEIQ